MADRARDTVVVTQLSQLLGKTQELFSALSSKIGSVGVPGVRAGGLAGDAGALLKAPGQALEGINKPFWANLLARDATTGRYAWTEVHATLSGFAPVPGGRFGYTTLNPAVEQPGVQLGLGGGGTGFP